MRLRELDAHFIASTENGWRRVDTIEKANGLSFQCPKCADGLEAGDNACDCGSSPHLEWCAFGCRHRKGAHSVICWFRNPCVLPAVGPDVDPKPGRWWVEGTSIDDLTFGHGEPPMAKSVQLIGGCNWHGNVTNGEAA